MSEPAFDSIEFSVEVVIDSNDFKEFAVFDIFTRLRRWIPLAIFAGIMSAFAVVCFVLNSLTNAVLLGGMLIVIGFGLPLAYVRQFFVSIKDQSKLLGLGEFRHVYTLDFSPEGVTVKMRGSEKEEHFAWKDVYGIYIKPNATYLYVSSTKAYILPASLVPKPDDALELFRSGLSDSKDKIHLYRR